MSLLITLSLDNDERASPIYAKAYIAHLLSLHPVQQLGGPRALKVRRNATADVMDALGSQYYGIEEETFQRDDVTDTWRHTTLQLSLRAVAASAPERIFEPAFRRGLIALLDLQETVPSSTNLGGFRTSREGFITSYATTQALDVFSHLEETLREKVNPARTFDLLCRNDGAHHLDSQELQVGRARLLMNSTAGSILMGVSVAAGLSIAALAIAFQGPLGKIGSRGLVVWAFILPALCSTLYLCVRLPSFSNRRIAVVVFTGFTALILPVITFLLS